MDTKRSASAARLVVRAALVGVLTFGAASPVSAGGTIRYVSMSATGLDDGSSWANAYNDLQDALAASVSADQIWVARGVYFPTATTSRTISFTLKTGVKVYGGFAGTETLLSQRDVAANPTILSGDLGTAGSVADNSYHVVKGGASESSAILDGFTITSGNANGTSPDNNGAGMYNDGSPRLANLTFSLNQASALGGGMYTQTGTPSLTHVAFIRNWANNGAGLSISESSPTLTDLTFTANTAGGGGGGLHNNNSSPTLTGATFARNYAAVGGGVFNESGSSPSLTNVAFVANWALNGGGMINGGGSNPTLANVSFTANWADYGGGIANDASSPNLTRVTFSRNYSRFYGGGMFSTGSSNAVLTDVVFTRNSSSAGGGMMSVGASAPQLTRVLFESNVAVGMGGGMYNEGGASLKNVTFSGNSAGASGGGIATFLNNPTLTNLTFSGNSASMSGGGILISTGAPTIADAIFWGNGTEITNQTGTPVITDSIVQGGYSCASCTNIINADPKLGSLQNNGGLTKTMALGAGSAAIDAGGVNSTCASKDQRSVTRPQGGKCDIGAYEVKALQVRSDGAYDGWVLESTEASGVGGSLNSTASTLRLGDDASNRQYRSVLSFDTAGLPDAGSVVLAKIKVRKQSITGTDPFTTHGTLMLNLRKPYFGAVAGLETSDFQIAATVASAGTISSTLTSGWYSGLLNSAGRLAVNKTGTTQLRLRFAIDDNNDSGADYLSFYSGNATSTYRPLLIVYYNP